MSSRDKQENITPKTERGLLISKEWIKKFFDHNDPKTCEIRTMSCKTGRTYLIETKGGGIVGECMVQRCIKVSFSELKNYNHKIPDERIKEYTEKKGKVKNIYVWVLRDVVKYDRAIEYKVPKGCVIWCKKNLPS